MAPQDDPSVPDSEVLWRRCRSEYKRRPGGDAIVKSSLFPRGDGHPISVHRSSLTTPERVLNAYPEPGIAGLRAAEARMDGKYGVVPSPTLNHPTLPDDPSHADIVPRCRTKSDARAMARACAWVHEPPDPETWDEDA